MEEPRFEIGGDIRGAVCNNIIQISDNAGATASAVQITIWPSVQGEMFLGTYLTIKGGATEISQQP